MIDIDFKHRIIDFITESGDRISFTFEEFWNIIEDIKFAMKENLLSEQLKKAKEKVLCEVK